jgi:hypothetical protein
MLEAALQDLEAVWTAQSAPIVGHLAEGSTPEGIRARAGAFGLTLPDDVVQWFAWHDGLAADRDRDMEMLPAMRPLGLDEALALGREIRAVLVPVPGLPAVLTGDWLPLLSDDAGEFLFVSVEAGADPAVWAFELSDPAAPRRRFEDLTGLARALAALFEAGLYRFDGESVRAPDPLAAERLMAGFRADGAAAFLPEVDTGPGDAAAVPVPVDHEAAARLGRQLGSLEGLARAALLLESVDALGTATVVEALRRLDLGAREEAASSLGYTGSPKAAPLLQALLDDPEDYVRETAAGAMGMVADPSVAPRLVPLLSSANRNLRKAAAFSLGELGIRDAIPRLLELTEDPVPLVRRAAATALGRIGGPMDIAPLVALLDDGDPETAQMAAWALGAIGDPGALGALEEASRSRDPTLARIARESVAALKAEG